MATRYFGKTVNGVTIRDGEQILFRGKPALIKETGSGLGIFQPAGYYSQWKDKWPMTAQDAAFYTDHIIQWGGVFVGAERVTEPLIAPNPDRASHIDYAEHERAYAEMFARS
ncbi:MAG: hypothetical protein HC828_02070 [Blastochloris sp.]|nr:hypothetical protein [Blastochloris sp.]